MPGNGQPKYFYLVRRARWLEGKVKAGDPASPGYVFDYNELNELKAALSALGVQYGPAANVQRPARQVARPKREVVEEEPPLMEEVYVVPKEVSRPRAKAWDVDERSMGRRYMPRGL